MVEVTTLEWHRLKYTVSNDKIRNAGSTNFPKIQKTLQNSRRKKSDIQQVPYWWPINIRCHCKHVFTTVAWSQGFVHPWISESSMGQDAKGNRRGLISGSVSTFSWRDWGRRRQFWLKVMHCQTEIWIRDFPNMIVLPLLVRIKCILTCVGTPMFIITDVCNFWSLF